MPGKRMLRIGFEALHPIAQRRLMHTPRSRAACKLHDSKAWPLLTCPPCAPDLLPPSGREWVALGVVAFVPDPALAEREFVLRID
jgi:hypothetical protein